MIKWNFTIHNGIPLREAISNDDFKQTVECLYKCFEELYNKMSDEDKDCYQIDIEDIMEILKLNDTEFDEDTINDYLQEFYDICDDVRAFVAL